MCLTRNRIRPPSVVVDQMDDRRRPFMSDYRNSEYGNDPLRRDPPYDPDARAMNATWGWIAAAVFIVVVLAVAFGIGHEPGQSGTNTASYRPAPACRDTHGAAAHSGVTDRAARSHTGASHTDAELAGRAIK